ncbi:MAG: hypothetical protein QOK04_2589 [Solirubrobacteraceae bacterium]|jgi:hypothetical protein|nr:hypothetical protein [Solirubrobacteraceae bacterium]
MATIESPETYGFAAVEEFGEAQATWPRGDRPAALREAAGEFRERFKAAGEVHAIRTVDLVSAGYPVSLAFHGAARGINPFVNILNRLVVVQFDDFEGQRKTLVWEPTIPEGSAEAPFYEQLRRRFGDWLSYNVLTTEYHTVAQALTVVGLSPADVDYVSFDHLHVQDLRMTMGTVEPVAGENEPREPFFPNAKFVFQRREVDTFASIHPTQWAWYVPGGMDQVRTDNLVQVDGDVALGVGCALLFTPGHTDGNQSLCVNTPDGVWVSSENGVAADSWHPHLSKIPGLRRWAEFFGREVVMNANTLEDSIDQYDSMIKEKAVADVNSRDPRWLNVFPSSEMAPLRRSWPVVPTFMYGGINYGRIEAPAASNGKA